MRFFDRRLNPSDSGTGIEVGDVKSSIQTADHGRWLKLDGGSIGAIGSGATDQGEEYRALFVLLWNSMADAQAPVSSGRGASANADFDAGKPITIPDARGRSLIGTGTGAGLTARTHGDTGGVEDTVVATHTHTDTLTAPAHTHTAGTLDVDLTILNAGGGAQSYVQTNGDATTTTTTNALTAVTGSTGGASATALTGSIDSAGVSPTDQNLGPWLALNWFIAY